MIKPEGKKGIYWCDFRTSSGERIRRSLHTTDKKEAKELEIQLKASADKKAKERRVGGITLKEAFTHALRVREAWRSAKSLHSIHQVYGMLEERFGPDYFLSELDDECLLEYGEELFDSGLTASTINKRFSIISVLFDEAIQWKKYDGRKPNTVRYKVKNGRKRLITAKEADTAVAYFRGSKSLHEQAMADLIITLADTGMRLSEALRINPRNIYRDSLSVLVEDTKNGESRIVPLTPRALQALSRSPVAPIFHPLDASYISHAWRRVRDHMGLGHEKGEFVLHAFRHTFGSALADEGMDAFRIQKAMGHKTMATTQGYVKVATASLHGIAEIMLRRYDQKSAQSMSRGADNDEVEND